MPAHFLYCKHDGNGIDEMGYDCVNEIERLQNKSQIRLGRNI